VKKKTTIHDIARALQINISTISRALNDHPGISQATKAAVREMAGKLDYRHNKLASSLRSGRTHIIGVIIPSAELHFFGSVVHAIEQVMNRNGYTVVLYQSNESYENERRGVETLLQLHVDGIIASIALGTDRYDHFIEVKKRNVPLILFDRTSSHLDVPTVTINDFKGGYMATAHLIRQGYKRIGHITTKQQAGIFNDRAEGYKKALADYGLPYDPELIRYGDVSIASGQSCTEELLNLTNKADAVFAMEDFTAMGAIQKLKSLNIAVPREFGVMGFANEAFSAYITPSLTTVDQQTREMGQAAAGLFLDVIAEKQLSNPHIVLDPLLIERESSARNADITSAAP
jgi:LacI family transcriptional regulator